MAGLIRFMPIFVSAGAIMLLSLSLVNVSTFHKLGVMKVGVPKQLLALVGAGPKDGVGA